jgi:hypothetical protein
MHIIQFTRIESSNADEVLKTAKQAKAIMEKHGAEFLRLSRFHSGPFAGQWLAASRYASWGAYGEAQEGLAKDPEWTKLTAHMSRFAEIMTRSISVGVDI